MVEREHNVDPDLVVEHEHTTHSQGFYLAIGICLLILTATTVGAAFVNLGPFNPVIALLIATIKATLVVLFFMHVKGASEKLTGAVVVSGFFFLAILISLSLADYLTRSWR
ncbi:MAG: cytochrome C oxidase subunit IV family protein [Terriglobales bacterium]